MVALRWEGARFLEGSSKMEDIIKSAETVWSIPVRKPKHGRKAKRGQPLGGRGGRAYRSR